VVIGGWTEGRGERAGGLGALLLGIPGDEGLRYVGKVGTGFSERARRDLLEDLDRLAASKSPFDAPLPARETSNAQFVRPALVGEVAYGEWTPAGRLRHPTWRGLRPDKKPKQVTVE
jgi:bifunctional non-homologous end joining protein LigD